jgi:hypothetical protein
MKNNTLFDRGGGVYCCKPNTESIGHPAFCFPLIYIKDAYFFLKLFQNRTPTVHIRTVPKQAIRVKYLIVNSLNKWHVFYH